MSDSNLQAALDRIEPEDWVADQGLDYRIAQGSSGTQVNLRECPRCGGTGWKVFLNAETGLGNCFHGSCVGEPGFTLYSFVKHTLGLKPRETAQHIIDYAKQLGWRPKLPDRYKRQEPPTTVKLPESVPLNHDFNLGYLEERGINGMTAQRFDLRYCESGIFEYTDHEGNDCEQRYDGRVIIPVRDVSGKIVTFQGRDITGTANRKYLFPPGLPGTGRYLYNGHRAMGKQHLVMGEGAFDVIAAEMAFEGFDDVGLIGSFGKSFSAGIANQDDQFKQLALLRKKGAESLTFMWDSERATIRDAIDAVPKIKRIIPHVRIAILPEGCDPNEADPLDVRVAYARAVDTTKANLTKLKFQYR